MLAMRNVTIKRTKRFVGCAGKMKVCIEDMTAPDLIINNIPCRTLGTLKNGEEKTFPIGEEARRLFVIAGSMSKSFCNDLYELPEGSDDLFLSGKNKFNPANGNAFRFDNNESESAIANRKKGTIKGLIVLIASIVVGLIVGCQCLIGYCLIFGLSPDQTSDAAAETTSSDQAATGKTFSSNGMSITLPDEFKKTKMEGFTVCYESEKVAVFAIKEPFSLMEGFENYTLDQYRDLVIKNNQLTYAHKNESNGLKYFTYDRTEPQTKQTYHYVVFVFKADDAFWLVQFACLRKDIDECTPNIMQWAETINFSN